ncbi:MAG: hypothetical protein E7329_06355 [Clostridiales bacterium]|nr:hypothetical protein [Clostridiales bacterium]
MKKLAWLTVAIFLAAVVLVGVLWNQSSQLESSLAALESEKARETAQLKADSEAAVALLQGELNAAYENAQNDAALYEAALADAYAQIEVLEQEMDNMLTLAQHEEEIDAVQDALLSQIDALNHQITDLQAKGELMSAALNAKEQDNASCLEQIRVLNDQLVGMHSQSDLEAAVANAIQDTADPLNAAIQALEAQVAGMYTQAQLDIAVSAGKAEAEAPLLEQIHALHEQIAGMHAQSDLEAAVANAIQESSGPLIAQIQALEAQIERMYTEDELNAAVDAAKKEAEQPLLNELEAWAAKADALVKEALTTAAQEAEKTKDAFLASDLGKDLVQAKDDLTAALSQITSHSQIVSALLPVADWMIQQGLVEDIEIQITIRQGEVTQTLFYSGATLSSLNLDALNDTAYEMNITVLDKEGNELTTYTFQHVPSFDENAVG